jgi:hypothetical protein
MEYLYKDKPKQDFELVQEVCHFMLNQRVDETKPLNNEWGAIYVEGRDRQIRDVESFCAVKSFKLFSKYNAPVYLFLHNDKNLLFKEYGLLDRWNIKVIKIPLLDSLEKYSEFCIKELYYLLPKNLKHVITIQPDAMLLKEGFEDYAINSGCDWLSPHWKHYAAIEAYRPKNNILGLPEGWGDMCRPTAIGNGGFSYRKVESLLQITDFWRNVNPNVKLRERGRNDDRPPMEDLYFTSFLSVMPGFKMPTLKQCDEFAVDPLTLDIWKNKQNWPLGFHYVKAKSEFPPCNHN